MPRVERLFSLWATFRTNYLKSKSSSRATSRHSTENDAGHNAETTADASVDRTIDHPAMDGHLSPNKPPVSISITPPASIEAPGFHPSNRPMTTAPEDIMSVLSNGSSDFDYMMQNGRALLVGSVSLIPQDLEEMDRADVSHGVLKFLCRTNHVAPLPHTTSRILEVGCGSGLWCKEMALEFPGAEIIGCDMTEAGFRDQDEMPANTILEFGNVLQGLKYMDAEFDYVHQRALWSIPTADWPRVMDTLFRVTAPMGTCEVGEAIAMCYPPNIPVCARVNRWVISTFASQGVDQRDGARIEAMMATAGFAHLRSVCVHIPFGEWHGVPGRIMARNWLRLLNGIRASPSGSQMPEDEFQEMVTDLETMMADPKATPIYCPMYFVFGRRPLDPIQ